MKTKKIYRVLIIPTVLVTQVDRLKFIKNKNRLLLADKLKTVKNPGFYFISTSINRGVNEKVC